MVSQADLGALPHGRREGMRENEAESAIANSAWRFAKSRGLLQRGARQGGVAPSPAPHSQNWAAALLRLRIILGEKATGTCVLLPALAAC